MLPVYVFRHLAAIALLQVLAGAAAHGAEPPYWGTLFIAPDTINEKDPSVYAGHRAMGTGERLVWDSRVNRWNEMTMRLYAVEFRGEPSVEFQVNMEIPAADAEAFVETYGRIVGQVPRVLRSQLKTVTIHGGKAPFGGGNENMVVQVEQGVEYARDGILEEAVLHELSHTSLDPVVPGAGWSAAQRMDGSFLSRYAQENPDREDVAETFPIFLAVEYRKNRVPKDVYDAAFRHIPARMNFFRKQRYDMTPFD